MIHQITTSDLPIAIKNMCEIVVMSTDSRFALIRGNNIENITPIQSFQDEDLNSILIEDFWRQPCNNC